ncbi:alcohol dehydrogenase catalytic domain-containing protein [Ferroplasma sp.]|uniref:alcohol dehydrogenase catalytic domain-containing protein n=1 Tax=Ferroplasma sp. TaxID=2591003 RepID=UPI00307D56A7
MKAIEFDKSGIDNIKIVDTDLKGNGIKVKVIKAGLNPLDYNLIAGNVVYNVKPMPHIPGSEVMGIAMEDGKNIRKGDRVIVYNRIFDNACDMCYSGNEHLCYNGGIWGVITNGGYSEYIKIDEQNLFRVPEPIDDNTAVSIGIGALTSYRSLKRSKPKINDKILIYGAGNTGIFTVQLAHKMGLDVYVYSRNKELEELGIKVIDSIPEDFLADIIINPLGGKLFGDSIKHLRRKGKIVTYGVLTGRMADLDIAQLYTNELEITGSTGGTRKDLSELLSILEKSNFRLPMYKEYSLWDIKDALYAFKERVNGRIVLNL